MANKDSNARLRVLVTGVGGRSVGHQILHALQLLGDKYEILVADADPYSFGLYQVPRRFVVPAASEPGYLDALCRLLTREAVQVVIPGTEAELKAMAARREDIDKTGCFLLANPPPVVELCANKHRLGIWLKTNGFSTPDTAAAGDWRDLVVRKGFPLVAKPAANSSGSQNVAILGDESEVLRYLDTCGSEGTIFQEYVDAADDEYTVGVCVDRGSRVIDSIVLRRKLTGLSLGARRVLDGRVCTLSTGYSQGYIVRQPLVQSECERLVKAIGICGPANLQCRLYRGQVMVFEVHPRFSGTTSLRADVGFNEPDMLIRTMVRGERLERQDYQTDVAVIRAFQSVVVPMSEMDAVPRIR